MDAPLVLADHGTTHCEGAEGGAKGGAKGAAQAGRLAYKAAVVLNLADWSGSSRKQAPACYTSARRQASRCETDVA